MASTLMAEQLAVAESQRTESDRLQRAATVLASFVLIPSLVAAVFGANVSLPAANTKAGLTAMVLFMFGFGLASWWFAARDSFRCVATLASRMAWA